MTGESVLRIIGGGPAGSAAAISARQMGIPVELFEQSKFPRHKVCGEFLSPEIVPVLRELGVWDEFLALQPARISRLLLCFGSSEKSTRLPEPAYGLTRYRLDQLLANAAIAVGTNWRQERAVVDESPGTVLAIGRRGSAKRSQRLFGFKAHYSGPVSDAVELYFFSGCYVGINCVEGQLTNICGLGPENLLRRFNFQFDELTASSPALSRRLAPLTRAMDWISTGPLIFQNHFKDSFPASFYPAGDALSFVDPFTGSGLLGSIKTGRMAGLAAAAGTPSSSYLKHCNKILGQPYEIASLCRSAAGTKWMEYLAPLIPARMLFQLTRPAGKENR